MGKAIWKGLKESDDPLFSVGFMTGSLDGLMLRIKDFPKDTDTPTKPSKVLHHLDLQRRKGLAIINSIVRGC